MTVRLKEQLARERRLISTISHDLKTPLTSIIGYAEAIKDGIYFDEKEIKESAEIIYHKASYLGQLLEELLELAKIQSPTFSLKKEMVDLAEFIRLQVLSFRPQLEENDFNINMELPDSPVFVLIDPEKMERVISNLIDNILKHAWQGKYLGIGLKRINSWVEISFIDRGDGIEKEEREKILENYYQTAGRYNTEVDNFTRKIRM